ncbi:MAG: adenosylcobinamide-GDP ribazoletransferase [Candidatus Lustribacter sp.]
MNALRTAFAYFSILPARSADAPGAGALAALPLVGVALGALAGALGWLASLIVPAPLAVVVASGAALVASGAIHLDGFLDAADALFASVPAERRREILKDPHHGTFALAGLAIVVPAWLAALAAIPPAAWPWAFAFCAGTARAGAVANAFRLPYAPGGASAHAFERRPPPALFALGVLVSAACGWLHPWLLVLVPAAAAFGLGLGSWCARRLDGVLVGDCYGAIVVVLDAGLLAAVATALRWGF